MKKLICFSLLAVIGLNSCGTICGGKITDCQKHKPVAGSREIRPAALAFDILTGGVLALVVDFADGAMYRPCK